MLHSNHKTLKGGGDKLKYLASNLSDKYRADGYDTKPRLL